MAPADTSVLTADSATTDSLCYLGNVKVPQAGGGTVTMMKFSANSLALTGSDVTLAITDQGTETQVTSPAITFSGNVTLYATSLSGTLQLPDPLGSIPITLDPTVIGTITGAAADALTACSAALTLTGVATDQAIVTSDSLGFGSFTIKFPSS